MLRFVLLLLLMVWPAAGRANVVADMRVVGDLERTRFIVDLAGTPEFRVLRLANPYRLVIDMPDVEFAAFASAPGRGLVSEFRYGLIGPGKARIVLDLAEPADVAKTFVLDAVGTEPARLVVDLVPTTAEAFAAAALQDQPPAPAPAAEVAATEPATGAPVVVIDPGHGGIDSGALGGDGLIEKSVTMTFAAELARRLKERGRVTPVLTREGDTFLSLPERVEVARSHQAALFVSVHADSVREDYVSGATVYTLSDDASDALAAAVAARENRSDILAGFALEEQPDEVADILFDLARRETRNLSVRFAKSLVADLEGKLPLNKSPWRRAAFRVLKAPDVPSVLLELGYLSNDNDGNLFRSTDWHVQTAETVAQAIEGFLGTNIAGQ